MVILILLILGLCFGSFVNAFVWRHYKQAELKEQLAEGKKSKKKAELTADELSITKGRSMCTHCHHELAAKDLIPIVSYLWLRGKCRYCGKKIEDSPLAELVTPLLFVISYLAWPHNLSGEGLVLFGLWLIFLIGFVALILYDLRWFLLPHSIVMPLIGLAFLQVLLQSFVWGQGIRSLLMALLGALVIGGLFFVLYTVSKGRWIGGGDITLGVLLGLLVGGVPEALLVIFLASFIGTLIAVPLLATGKADRTTHLPFGPFLIVAGIVVVLWGSRVLDWYGQTFLGL